mmetsp:Transcript_39643/g.58227  ORF Transcript_39643/g.58227 Transcript_39643/m.58227 type:complete len:120 (-) Transcript_39643:175-534(-)|eukprot:CAMPEP_0195521046 /NCGR_PEP_ID=MMETSP0794_2-20130614/17847_1 /TAXON_ID=515487 /ORGANISM="Stephanopyxis turris, Strain CCMP 815" /LENGTH=119 /DNA_ID=CAMNT_0040650505 /DNA_START=45 /DNA_END=404 /DNA_ORIENTATION=-
MALGPLARVLAQAAILGVSILTRALPAAYAQAIQNAKKNGGAAAAQALRKTMERDEALNIMNLTEGEATPEAIQKQYDRYFAANAVEKGGSFYLQSKVVRAKELLDEFEKDKKMEKGEQ